MYEEIFKKIPDELVTSFCNRYNFFVSGQIWTYQGQTNRSKKLFVTAQICELSIRC